MHSKNSIFPILQSSRLILRQITQADIANVHKGLSHPEVIQYYGVSFATLEATQEQMDWYANLEATETGIFWAVCLATDGTFLGVGGMNDWSKVHGKAEIGFWLLPEHWGNGYMQEAMPLIFEYGFGAMGLRRIEGFVEVENAACKRAVAKLGFEHEGTMRDCEVKHGRVISVDIFAKFP